MPASAMVLAVEPVETTLLELLPSSTALGEDDVLKKQQQIIEELKIENKDQHDIVSKRIDVIEKDIKEIGKIKWMTVGCGVLLAVLTTAFSTLASGWWTPSEMQMQHEGHIHQQNVPSDGK
mgnify:CR=1 FL=1